MWKCSSDKTASTTESRLIYLAAAIIYDTQQHLLPGLLRFYGAAASGCHHNLISLVPPASFSVKGSNWLWNPWKWVVGKMDELDFRVWNLSDLTAAQELDQHMNFKIPEFLFFYTYLLFNFVPKNPHIRDNWINVERLQFEDIISFLAMRYMTSITTAGFKLTPSENTITTD